MVESSKILTVSYGTFSCTLEGFDDSFSTMKAIAEYFRDLAAGDRYFGAEPPTPDAEMLTRIAEREIARRVEMRTSGDGIVLRALEAAPAAAPVPQQTAPAAAAPAPAAVTPAPQHTAPAAAAPAPAAPAPAAAPAMPAAAPPAMPPASRPPVARAPEPVAMPKAEAPAHPDPDSVAAKLQRIRAVVGGNAPRQAAYTEDMEDAEEVPAPAQDTAAAPVAEAPAPVAEAPAPVAETAAPIADTPAPTADTTAPVPDTAEASPLSEAETDAAIARAVASFDTPATEAADDLPAQAPAPAAEAAPTADTTAKVDTPFGDETDDQIDTVLRNLERAGLRQTRRDDAPATAVTPPAPLATPADQSATDRADAAPARPAPAAEGDTAPAMADPLPVAHQVPVQPSAPRARILRVTRRPRTEEEEEAATTPQTDDTAAMLAAVAAATRAPVPTAAPATPDAGRPAATPATADADAAAAPAAPAVEALRTAVAQVTVDHDDAADDLTNDLSDDLSDDLDDLDDQPAAAALPDADAAPSHSPAASVAVLDGADDLTGFDRSAPSTLSDADEADLQRTLAALGGIATPARTAEAAAADLRARREPLPDTSEAEMSRIMTQADAQLADPGASRRRNAIAHLKAAVAATEAARQLGENGSPRTETEGAFRQDLNQVVRPRRAAPRADMDGDRTDRPRPAPLKLVASQRIDTAQTGPAASQTPVQPRRVSVGPVTAAPAAATADGGRPTPAATSFAAYAKALGATSLQDLLEAAAAYTAYVEGSEDFSRPHIMQKVRQTVEVEFSREDGLRSFGTLLRQGRIERVRNGRFAVSDQTRFKPDQIAAQG